MTTNSIQSQSNYNQNPYITSKALGSAASGQGVSSSQPGDTSVQAWVSDNTSLYNSVVAGTSGLSQSDIQQFEQWWSWAQSQMSDGSSDFGGDYGITPVDPNAGTDGISSTDSDPFGGQPGTSGNLVYTDDKTHLGFIGETRPMDVWSTDVTLDVSSAAAKVNVEKTSDTRTQPAEDVYKVTVTDVATGKTSTYFLHNIDDITSFKINTPGGKHVTDPLGLAKVGSYHKATDTDPNAAPESSIPYEEQDDGTRLVEAPVGQTVELTPVGDGEDHNWEVYGDYNMTLRPSDTVVILQKLDGSHEITVTHRDGSKDSFNIHKGSKGNVNATPENTTIEMEEQGPPLAVSGATAKNLNVAGGTTVMGGTHVVSSKGTDPLPAGFEDVTLNAGATGSASTDLPADATPPDSTNGGTATFNNSKDVNVYSSDGFADHNITVPMNGTVTIHGASYADTMKVDSYQAGPPQKWVIEVFKDGDPQQATKFTISGGTGAKVILDASDPSSVTATQSGDLSSVQIGLDGTSATSSNATWPTNLEIPNIEGHDNASGLAGQIATAISSNPQDWQLVSESVNGMFSDTANANDTIRALITGLWEAAGSDQNKFDAILKLIPEGIRKDMASVVMANTGESGEQSGARWNSQDTANEILGTLDANA